jgi:bla regulator protein blaR1
MSETLVAAVTAHLWQSTLVMGVTWLATLALRTNRPRVRYWLWVAASVKFLVPFSWLVSLGAQFEWRTAPPITQPAATFVMEQILAPPVVTAAPAPAPMPVQPVAALPWVLASVWVLGCVVVLFWWWRQSRPLRTALREAKPIELAPEHDVEDLVVLSSVSTIEPGVVGVWRPILLLPNGLVERLTSTQLKAVIAHERCHIRCYDNLAAAIHMLVETLFWFHPVVWWLERRLVDERERACDEAVLIAGNDPVDYAEGILTVCRYTVSAPLACVTGVSGADLRARIESIGRNHRGAHMTVSRRIAVAFFGLVLIGVPVVSGVVSAIPLLPVGQEPTTPVFFEVAAVRLNKSGERSADFGDRPGGRFEARNTPLHRLILEAYRISENQLVDAPEWTRNERFDVNAKLEREAPIVRGGQSGERQLALRSLLAQRFKLTVHRESRQVPMYALVMARADRKPGPGLKPSATDCSPQAVQKRIAAAQAGQAVTGMCGRRVNTGRIQFGGYPLSEFVRVFQYGGRNVIDRTGLTGSWDFELTFTPDRMELQPGQEPPPFDPNGPSLSAALQEQLGLKLEPITGTIEVLVVDRVERLDAQDAVDPLSLGAAVQPESTSDVVEGQGASVRRQPRISIGR